MSESIDHFAPVPLRFIEANRADELDATHVLVGTHLAAQCYEARNTADGVATVRLRTLADLCGKSTETIRKKLHDLRDRGEV